MPTWKKNIFIRVITRRIKNENRTMEDILTEYQALTAQEVSEISNAIITQ